jgi:release factor glutamine methyltransferase
MILASHRHAMQVAQALGLDRLDAQLLLLHALQRPDSDRAWLLAHDDDLLAGRDADVYRELTLRRAAGEPLAYIVGHKEFFGLDLLVDSRVLVPRPDTETLVQWALELLQAAQPARRPSLLDLGTGSGAIALAIAHTRQKAGQAVHVIAVDASMGALALARENAHRLQADIEFLESRWFEKVSGRFDVIASNPPYIANADPHLAALAHEPLEALTAGADGLDDIRQIIQKAPDHLEPGGWLLFEHGFDQQPAVLELLEKRGFLQTQSRLDLAGIARCSGGWWQPCNE